MKHYGDITKLSGYELPVVDVITGGSPCQDLSVAGKRAGLAGERSGLFMEQMRIVKEMRERDRLSGRSGFLVRPRYMVWENVPGAFSSTKGADFAAVIEEIIKVAEPGASVCVRVPERGWTKSGCYYADDGSWSIAWRVHDAQFWGVPQRRKRISLVADFGGLSAPEILFERQGLRGDTETGGTQGERIAAGAEKGAGSTICLQGNGIDRADTAGCNGRGWCEDVSYTLNTIDRPAVYPMVANTLSARYDGSQQPDKGTGANIVCAGFKSGQGSAARGIGYQEEVAPTLPSEAGGNSVPAVVELSCGNPWDSQSERVYHGDGAWHSLNANSGGGQNRDAVLAFTQNQRDEVRDLKDVAGALAAEPGMKQQTYVFENHSQDSRNNPMGEICETVSAKYGTGGNNQPLVVSNVLPFDTTQITSDKNWSNPHYGDPCHPLAAGAHPPAVAFSQQGFGDYKQSDVASSCKMRDYKDSTDLIAATLSARDYKGPCAQDMCNNFANYPIQNAIVRRLTPLECERLQGYPDGWTDIGDWTDSKGKKRKAADNPRYKALGNSIALPFWQYLARRICAQYERDITMGSLFDGIGGFPLVFERCGAKAVWASEIEEFAIAVTKKRFPEETRTDICGIYCTKGFVVDGKCERFREYQTKEEKRDRHGGGRDDLKNKGGVCHE